MALPASPECSDLERLQLLMRRDRQRKLIALVVLSGVTGAAVFAQAVWLLAVLAAAAAGGTAWLRSAARRNQPRPPGTTSE